VLCAAGLLAGCAAGGDPEPNGASAVPTTSGAQAPATSSGRVAPGSPSTTAGPGTPGAAAPTPGSTGAAAPGQGSAGGAGAPGQAAPSPRAACVEAALRTLSPQARAGQLLMVGVPAGSPADGASVVRRYRVGGVFLRGRTAGTSALQRSVAALRASARAARVLPLHVAADEEGGAVQTIRGGSLPSFPSATTQGGWTASRLDRETRRWAGELARLGVTLDLAPVADTVPASLGRRNPPIGRFSRQYGSTPDAVAQDVVTVTRALQARKVGATVKHFPGLGRVLANTDTSSAAVDRVTTATDPFLRPFQAAIRAGTAAVMVSSARYPRLDARRPAMWSPAVVTGLLRTRLGYTGMVVSDDLGNAVAARSLPVGRRAVDFVRAGGDLVLTVRPEQAGAMTSALAAAARGSSAYRARVDDAVRHVLASKYDLGLIHCGR
jgi:beta-N-acetylhexosaminidase